MRRRPPPLLASLPAYQWHLVELCAGSAALTLHALGSKCSVMPYQGSKWVYRHTLAQALDAHGVRGVHRATLVEVGEWARTWKALVEDLDNVLTHVEVLTSYDPRSVYDRLAGAAVAGEPAQRAAEHLFLQRVNVYGKAVAVTRDGRWMAHGFSRTHAYGTEATRNFQAVNSQTERMPARLRMLPAMAGRVDVLGSDAMVVNPEYFTGRVLAYIDPPYQGTTGYPEGDLTRDQVCQLAERWAQAGHAVAISEAEPIRELGDGWSHVFIGEAGRSDAPFRSAREEWLTVRGRLAQGQGNQEVSCSRSGGRHG